MGSAARRGAGGQRALGRDYSVTDGGRRKGERGRAANGVPLSPPSTSSKTIVIRFISLMRFSLSAEGERGEGGEGESRFRGHFVFGFTYWAVRDQFSCSLPTSNFQLVPHKFDRNFK